MTPESYKHGKQERETLLGEELVRGGGRLCAYMCICGWEGPETYQECVYQFIDSGGYGLIESNNIQEKHRKGSIVLFDDINLLTIYYHYSRKNRETVEG